MRLTREQILAAKLRTEEVEVPEWGGSVLIGEFPVARMQDIIAKFGAVVGNDPRFMVDLLVSCCLDPQFSQEDAEELIGASSAVVLRLATRIMQLNGLTEASLDEARGKS